MENQNKTDTRLFDLIKGGILLFLVVVLVFALARGRERPPDVTLLPTQSGTSGAPGSSGTLPPGAGLLTLTPGELGVAPPIVSPEGGVSFSGTGPAGSTVEIWANGEKVGEVAVSAGGTWTYEAQPPPGEYQVSVVTRGPDGMVIEQTSPVGITVPPGGGTAPASNVTPGPGTPAAPAPAISAASVSETGEVTVSGTGAPGSTVVIYEDGVAAATAVVGEDGTFSATYQSTPGDHVFTAQPETGPAPGSSGQTPAVSAASVSETGEVTVSGTGAPGSTVVIYEDGVAAATAVVGEDGTFSATYQSTPGDHVFTAQPETGPAPGSSGQGTPGAPPTQAGQASATQTPSQPTPTPTLIPIPPGGLDYIVQPGDTLMDLARRYYGDPSLWVNIFVATNAKAYTDPSYAILLDSNVIVAGSKIFIPEG